MTRRGILSALVLLLFGLGGAIYAFTPTLEERVSMLVRDGRQREALAELSGAFSSGLGSSMSLLTMARLQEAAGDFAAAANSTEMYLLLHPNDAHALAALAARYGVLGQATEVLHVLRRLVLIEPTRERVVRVLALCRLHGLFDEEREILETLREAPILVSEDLSRLGTLLASAGLTEKAVEALQRADELATEASEADRILLFELLLALERSGEAAQRGEGWLKAWRKPWLAVRLALRIAEASGFVDAAALSRTAVRLHPEIRFYLATQLATRGKKRVAAALLTDWPGKNVTTEPTEEEVDGYLTASAAIGELAPVMAKYLALRSMHGWARAQAGIAEGILDIFGSEAFRALRTTVSSQMEVERPILAARIALLENQPTLAVRILEGAARQPLGGRRGQAGLTLLRQLVPDHRVLTAFTGQVVGGSGPLSRPWVMLALQTAHPGASEAPIPMVLDTNITMFGH